MHTHHFCTIGRLNGVNIFTSHFSQGRESKYSAANVCIVPGGRAGLTHLAASLGDVNVGYFLPDYTGKFPAGKKKSFGIEIEFLVFNYVCL